MLQSGLPGGAAAGSEGWPPAPPVQAELGPRSQRQPVLEQRAASSQGAPGRFPPCGLLKLIRLWHSGSETPEFERM